METGQLDGTCVFKIGRTTANKWKVERFDLTWGDKNKTSFIVSKMGYFDTPGEARAKKQKFIDYYNLVNTGKFRTFGVTKLQVYGKSLLIVV